MAQTQFPSSYNDKISSNELKLLAIVGLECSKYGEIISDELISRPSCYGFLLSIYTSSVKKLATLVIV